MSIDSSSTREATRKACGPDTYILDPCILGKMLGANGGKLTFWPPQPQEPLAPWGQAINPSSLASWLQDALGLKEIR